MLYMFNRFESSFFEYWPNKNLRIFICSMHNFTKYFKFRFSHYSCLCEQVGFLLRRSHLKNPYPIYYCNILLYLYNSVLPLRGFANYC